MWFMSQSEKVNEVVQYWTKDYLAVTIILFLTTYIYKRNGQDFRMTFVSLKIIVVLYINFNKEFVLCIISIYNIHI